MIGNTCGVVTARLGPDVVSDTCGVVTARLGPDVVSEMAQYNCKTTAG